MRSSFVHSLVVAAAAASSILACDRPPPVEAAADADAKAVLEPTKGNEASGTITFRQRDGMIEVSGPLAGMKPGQHGFHIHAKGDCSCPDAECAGPHFSPKEMPHALPDAEKRHVGDLGNVTADDDGAAQVQLEDRVLKLDGADSIVGRAVVLHAKADDGKTQPSGDSGPRIACGVIQPVKRANEG